MSERTVLIVEDGDEYLENLTRFVPGPTYVQARSGTRAVEILRTRPIDLIYLDMRFDTRQNNGDPLRGWRYLQNNQGLFVLNALSAAGFANHPVVLAYDFSREATRLRHLQTRYPRLTWVSDAVTPEEIRALMQRIFAESAAP